MVSSCEANICEILLAGMELSIEEPPGRSGISNRAACKPLHILMTPTFNSDGPCSESVLSAKRFDSSRLQPSPVARSDRSFEYPRISYMRQHATFGITSNCSSFVYSEDAQYVTIPLDLRPFDLPCMPRLGIAASTQVMDSSEFVVQRKLQDLWSPRSRSTVEFAIVVDREPAIFCECPRPSSRRQPRACPV